MNVDGKMGGAMSPRGRGGCEGERGLEINHSVFNCMFAFNTLENNCKW